MTDKDAFKEFLRSRPVAFYPDFAAIGGSVTAGVLLSQLFYWKDKETDPDGWIYKTQKHWKDEICLSRPEQETARRKLREAGILQEKLKGNPAKLYYRIDFDAMIAALSKLYDGRVQDAGIQHAEIQQTKDAGIQQSSMRESSKHSLHRLPSKNTTSKKGGKTQTQLDDEELMKAIQYIEKETGQKLHPDKYLKIWWYNAIKADTLPTLKFMIKNFCHNEANIKIRKWDWISFFKYQAKRANFAVADIRLRQHAEPEDDGVPEEERQRHREAAGV